MLFRSTIQNVVTYTVLISANNSDFKLLPGMTANVKVVVDKRDNVLKIPNAALRFRMPTASSQEKSGPPGMGASPMGSIGGLGASRSANTGQRQTSNPWGGQRKVWVLENGKTPVQKTIRVGVSDGNATEVLVESDGGATLKSGDLVIVGIASKNGSNSSSNKSPRLF